MTTTTENVSQYTFNNATPEAARQVRLLAEILDGHSTDVLTRTGVAPGWRCLDLGAGAGSISRWLAERVAPGGRVLAMDTDPRHIGEHEQLEVRADDVTKTDFGTDEFDLIHARLLLMHLPQRKEILRRLVGALRPGGLLVLSEWDCTQPERMLVRSSSEAADAFAAFQAALFTLGAANGASATWAGEAPLAMLDAGLVDVESEVHNRLWTGGEAGCLLHASNSRQLEAVLLKFGVTVKQLTVLREAMEDPETLAWSYPMVTTVGRRAEH
ncbi:MAG TPA: class I SAM-dependent methyltransferase [Micromonosporaceae bacterium]|nr:class I SAM-dependent methyltransferase [Micromonosporaceae bacterium]